MITEKDMQHGVDWQGEDLTGWIITEKFNGCRAYWDGANMWSRGGLNIPIPPEWRRALPEGFHLDGEIYAGTKGLSVCSIAVTLGRFTDDIKYVAFDAPKITGDYIRRQRVMAGWIPKHQKIILRARAEIADDTEHAFLRLRGVIQHDGEGIMVRHPDLAYSSGITKRLLKLKRHHLPEFQNEMVENLISQVKE